jgi:AraC-like DNA-binding protein
VAKCHEFFLVRKGRALLATPRRRFRLRPGELLLVEPGVEHEELPADPAHPYELSCFLIDGCRASLYDVSYSSAERSYLQHASEFVGPEDLGAAAALLSNELSRHSENWYEAAQHLLNYLTVTMLRRLRSGNLTYQTEMHSRDLQAWPRVEAAMMFCRSNLRMPLRIAEVAALFGYSPRHLSRLVAEHYGQTYSSQVRMLRTQAALALLADSSLPVAEVGETVGYPDPANFSRAFRREVGISPSAYRRSQTERR